MEQIRLGEQVKEYRTILMDPPWPERGGGKIKRGADRHYEVTGKLGDIGPMLALVRSAPVAPAEHAHLWCWYTDNYLEDALSLVRALGFTFKRTFVWVKVKRPIVLPCVEFIDPDDELSMGIGQYGRGCHEGMIFATRGSGQHESVWTGARDVRSVFHAPHARDEHGKRIHSRKPPESYELIERVSKGPRVELFARIGREGWDAWGNEAPAVTP